MPADIHFARLDTPADALRVACGAWRAASNWTTVPVLVTCPLCRRRAPFICAREARLQDEVAAPAADGPRSG